MVTTELAALASPVLELLQHITVRHAPAHRVLHGDALPHPALVQEEQHVPPQPELIHVLAVILEGALDAAIQIRQDLAPQAQTPQDRDVPHPFMQGADEAWHVHAHVSLRVDEARLFRADDARHGTPPAHAQ